MDITSSFFIALALGIGLGVAAMRKRMAQQLAQGLRTVIGPGRVHTADERDLDADELAVEVLGKVPAPVTTPMLAVMVVFFVAGIAFALAYLMVAAA